jgi:hypothetical protein
MRQQPRRREAPHETSSTRKVNVDSSPRGARTITLSNRPQRPAPPPRARAPAPPFALACAAGGVRLRLRLPPQCPGRQWTAPRHACPAQKGGRRRAEGEVARWWVVVVVVERGGGGGKTLQPPLTHPRAPCNMAQGRLWPALSRTRAHPPPTHPSSPLTPSVICTPPPPPRPSPLTPPYSASPSRAERRRPGRLLPPAHRAPR